MAGPLGLPPMLDCAGEPTAPAKILDGRLTVPHPSRRARRVATRIRGMA